MKLIRSFCTVALCCLCAGSIRAQRMNIRMESLVQKTEMTGELRSAYTLPAGNESVRPAFSGVPFSAIKEIDEADSSAAMLPISTDAALHQGAEQRADGVGTNVLHRASNTLFPLRMGDFERENLRFSAHDSGVEAVYRTSQSPSTFIITLIPATEATEGRLRDTYLTGIRQMAKVKGKNYFPKPTFLKFKGIRYTNTGVEGTYVHGEEARTQLQVFDCGSWIMTLTLDAEAMDEGRFRALGEGVVRYINPARLTALQPMNLKPNVDFDNESLKDTVVTGALVASALKKMDWATDHVSERERYAGFPDLYLPMHTEALTEYLRILNRKPNRTKTPENLRFYTDLKAIHEAGFLNEFVVETYENVMIVPASVQLNFPAYRRWKQQRGELKVDLLRKRYKINYRALPY